jgi:ferredoxin-NADP reductase
MNLQVVIVLSKPPEGWTGETGYITGDVLQRHLPQQYKRFQYFICGPTPLMDGMEKALPELGVPADKIHTERFDMV